MARNYKIKAYIIGYSHRERIKIHLQELVTRALNREAGRILLNELSFFDIFSNKSKTSIIFYIVKNGTSKNVIIEKLKSIINFQLITF